MKRDDADIRDTRCQSSGECLLRLGQLVKYLCRHGCKLEDVARELHVGRRVCALALLFATAPDSIKFRALFENWNLLCIRTYLRNLPITWWDRPT